MGDEISPGDILVEIETDKAQMDFECQEEGFLAKIFIDAGSKDIAVNTPMCVLAENKEDVDKFASFVADATATAAPVAAKTEPKADTPSSPAAGPTSSAPVASKVSDRVFASPLAKTLALEKGIDLKLVNGTGPDGRIVKDDILNYKPVSKTTTAAKTTLAAPTTAAEGQDFVDSPLSNIRKVIANRLSESKQTIPHYYMTQELDMTKILKLRQSLNAQANGKYKLSVNDFVIKAASLSLIDVPTLNSSWGETFVRQ